MSPPDSPKAKPQAAGRRPHVAGKFICAGDEKLYVRGVTYGTFRPGPDGRERHDPARVERDFAQMRGAGVNAVRTYTVPPRWFLDAAHAHGLYVMVGLPWGQHVAFLDGGGGAGLLSEQFISFYFRDPRASFGRLRAGVYASPADAAADMHDLHFVRTDQLNRGLYAFLVGEGYAEGEVSFVLGEGRILPRGRGRGDGQEWQRYYTPGLKAWVREGEDFLFRLFPEFDV
jgi:hypothetical protein